MRDDAILWLLSHEVEDGILCVAIIFHCTGTSRVSTNHGISSLCIVRHISLTDVRKGSQVRWTVWADRQQHKGQLQLHLLWEPHEDWIPYVLPRYGGLSPSCACTLVGDSASESLLVYMLVDIEGLLMDILFLQRKDLNPFPTSSKRRPVLYSILFCGSLHLFQSGAGWRLSEDNCDKLLSGSITTTMYIFSIVRDWCSPMGWVSSRAACILANPWIPAPSLYLHVLKKG